MGRRLNLTLQSAQVRTLDQTAEIFRTAAETAEERTRWSAIAKKTREAISFGETSRPTSLVLALTSSQVRAIHGAALARLRTLTLEEDRLRWSGIVRKTRDAIEFDDQSRRKPTS